MKYIKFVDNKTRKTSIIQLHLAQDYESDVYDVIFHIIFHQFQEASVRYHQKPMLDSLLPTASISTQQTRHTCTRIDISFICLI